MLKLNLGCGYNRLDGHVNVDSSAVCSPDLVVNLEETPWPWPSDSADTVVFNHSLEHMCAATDRFLALMSELYRVCCDKALIRICVPHPRHNDFIDDPTHVRIITPQLLSLFDRTKNDEWRANKCSNTPLAHYLGVDFHITHLEIWLEEPYSSQMQSGQLTTQQLDLEVKTKNNVAKEYRIEMRARKNPVVPRP
jgi:predicted SAM-dependent methyltransferase